MASTHRPRLPRHNPRDSDVTRAQEVEDAQAAQENREQEQGAISKESVASIRVNDPQKVHPVAPDDEEFLAPTEADYRADLEQKAVQARAESSLDNVVAFASRHKSKDQLPRERRLMRGKRAGILFGALSLIVIALVMMGLALYSPLLSVQSITVQGTQRVNQQSVRDALSPLEGQSLARVSDQEVKDLVGENIVIRDIDVEAPPPHELVLTVHERAAVAVVKEGDKFVLVDNDGVAIGTAKTVAEANVPLIDGGLNAVKSDSFSSLVRVLETLPQSLLSQMSTAEADSTADIKLKMKNGSTVEWGTDEQSEYKAQVLDSLIKATQDGLAGRIIDVSSPDHPVTK